MRLKISLLSSGTHYLRFQLLEEGIEHLDTEWSESSNSHYVMLIIGQWFGSLRLELLEARLETIDIVVHHPKYDHQISIDVAKHISAR